MFAALEQTGRQAPAAVRRLAQQQQAAGVGRLRVGDDGDRADEVLRGEHAGNPAPRRARQPVERLVGDAA
jgi:hypothetical protein